MSDFVVLDFETANILSRNSAIEIGLVRYRADRPVDSYQSLISPPPGTQFQEKSTKIHGITQEMIKGSPSFDQILDEVLAFIGNDPVVGHNVTFDLQVLYESARHYGLQIPTIFSYFCTRRLATKIPDLGGNTLGDLCEFFSVKNGDAHRAIGDCLATGECALAIAEYLEISIMNETQKYRPTDQVSKELLMQQPKRRMPEKVFRKWQAQEMSSNLGSDKGEKFKGMKIVFSGSLTNFAEKKDAQKLVIENGGLSLDNVAKDTTYVVTNEPDSQTSKLKKVSELRAKGFLIKVISEEEFLALLQ